MSEELSNMSGFMDLNLRPSLAQNQNQNLRNLLETAAQLGFSTVAINYVYDPASKKKQEIPSPTPVKDLMDPLPTVQGRSRPIRVLNRLTVVMSETNHFRPNAAEYRAFDLLAVFPTTEKLFHTACMTLDVDIICISVTEKLPFFFKRAPVNGAAERGLVFEVTFAPSLRDSSLRRYSIANAASLVESCKGKNVILSSGAEQPLELRGPYDITNLGLLFGLSDGDAKEAVSTTCRSVVLHAETRGTASGIVWTRRCSSGPVQQEAPPGADGDAPAAKRARGQLTTGAEPQPKTPS